MYTLWCLFLRSIQWSCMINFKRLHSRKHILDQQFETYVKRLIIIVIFPGALIL